MVTVHIIIKIKIIIIDIDIYIITDIKERSEVMDSVHLLPFLMLIEGLLVFLPEPASDMVYTSQH